MAPLRGVARSMGALVAAGAVIFSSCSGNDDSQQSPADSVTVLPTEVPSDSSLPDIEELPADVTAAGVVLAATLIAAGKIDEAVETGLVTPAEVDKARTAIESGTLGSWVERAEAE